jgi:hypothetical protein
MSDKQNTKALPSHRVYSVSRNGDQKATWTEIGAAWPHQDSKGFNLTFTARPLEGAQIVLRVATPATSKAQSSRRTGGRYAELNAASAGEGGAQ